ncbi:MAG TPA: hypothetical protein VN661_03750 [Candidatus Acidoferrales bacterium]|nr:hypothetical protein [Candidatus Acidoferrales bacterium]
MAAAPIPPIDAPKQDNSISRIFGAFGKAFAWILCVWAIYVICKVGLAAAFA